MLLFRRTLLAKAICGRDERTTPFLHATRAKSDAAARQHAAISRRSALLHAEFAARRPFRASTSGS